MLVKIKGTDIIIFRSTPKACKAEFPEKLEKTSAVFDDNGKQVKRAPQPKPVEFIYEQNQFEQQALLNDTDWYLSRKLETGEDLPEEIKKLRAEARAFLSS